MQAVILNEVKRNEESREKKGSLKRHIHLAVTFLLIFFPVLIFSQKKYVLIDIQNQKQYIKQDSLSAIKFLDSLSQNHYFFTELKDVKRNGTTTEIYFDKGKNYNEGWIKLSDSISSDLKLKKEFYTKNLDSLKRTINQQYIKKGYSFNRIKSQYQGLQNGNPVVRISVIPSEKRTINGFVFKGYEKIPTRFVKNLEKEFTGKNYDEKNLLLINTQLQNHPFIILEKLPQTLFTKDSTQIYLFTQKRKSNTFDGVLGFGNDEKGKFTLNGTLNLNFRNMFNGFETVNLYWQRNPNRGQTFDLHTDIPYLFKSNLGFRTNMNIYRQDSTFANVKILPGFYYHISPRQKIGLRGNFEVASVLDSLYTNAKDFSRKGIGIWYEYTKPTEVELFLHNTFVRAETDFLNTKYEKDNLKDNQIRYFITGEKNFHLKGNHYLNIKAESASLITKNALSENEIFRFGGWNSLRGFNENSILGNFYAFGGTEYRYLINTQAFFDVFVQYAQVNNKLLSANPKFYSFGTGFNFFLPIGLMSFQISNGSQFGDSFNFRNTKIHWGILTRF